MEDLASLPDRGDEAGRDTTVLPPLPQRRSGAPQTSTSTLAKLGLQAMPAPLSPLTERQRAEAGVSDPKDRRQSADEAGVPADRVETSEADGRPFTPELRSPTARGPSRPAKGLETSTVSLPPLPKVRPPRISGLFISFLVCVAVPLVAIGVYLFAFASYQHVSEELLSAT